MANDSNNSNWGDALTLIGAGLNAYSQFKSGQQQNTISQYNATLDINAAQTSLEEAQYNSFLDQEYANINEFQVRRAGAAAIGQQRVAYAKSGVVLTSGTPLQVMANTAQKVETNALTVRYGGKLQSTSTQYAGQVKAASLLAQSNVDTYTGQTAQYNSVLDAFSSLIGGFAKVA